MSYVPPGKVVGDWHPDNRSTPAHYRFRLGPNAPIVVGDVQDAEGSTIQIVVAEGGGSFVRAEFMAGAPFGPYDAARPTAAGLLPVGEPLIVDIQKSVDGGNTYTSVFGSTAKMLQFPTGLTSPVSYTFLDGSWSVNYGDYLKAHVVQTDGTSQNILLSLLGFFIAD